MGYRTNFSHCFLMIFLLAYSPDCVAASSNSAALQDISDGHYKVSYEMRHLGNPFDDPNQRELVQSIDLVRTDESIVFKSQNKYQSPPVYGEPGTFGYKETDYDSDGNLILHRSVEKVGYFGKSRNETLEKFEALRISPTGEVTSKSTWLLRSLYNPDDTSSLSEFKNLLKAPNSTAKLGITTTVDNGSGSELSIKVLTFQPDIDRNVSDLFIKSVLASLDASQELPVTVTDLTDKTAQLTFTDPKFYNSSSIVVGTLPCAVHTREKLD